MPLWIKRQYAAGGGRYYGATKAHFQPPTAETTSSREVLQAQQAVGRSEEEARQWRHQATAHTAGSTLAPPVEFEEERAVWDTPLVNRVRAALSSTDGELPAAAAALQRTCEAFAGSHHAGLTGAYSLGVSPWAELLLARFSSPRQPVTSLGWHAPLLSLGAGSPPAAQSVDLARLAEHYAAGARYELLVSAAGFLEREGLGISGDPLNPDGDLTRMREASLLLRPRGVLIVALPIAAHDAVVDWPHDAADASEAWRARRVYGLTRLPLLLEGYVLLGRVVRGEVVRGGTVSSLHAELPRCERQAAAPAATALPLDKCWQPPLRRQLPARRTARRILSERRRVGARGLNSICASPADRDPRPVKNRVSDSGCATDLTGPRGSMCRAHGRAPTRGRPAVAATARKVALLFPGAPLF
jgi:hypothetical protein